jgi:hypothetical protein
MDRKIQLKFNTKFEISLRLFTLDLQEKKPCVHNTPLKYGRSYNGENCGAFVV